MPSSKNYKRDLIQEYKTQCARGETAKRAKRNAARAKLMKAGVVSKGDGKDVNHKNGIGGGNGRGNLNVQSEKTNRSNGGKAGNKAGKAAGARKGHAARKTKVKKPVSKSGVIVRKPTPPTKKKTAVKKKRKPTKSKFVTKRVVRGKKVRF